jgi:hypothetical protein
MVAGRDALPGSRKTEREIQTEKIPYQSPFIGSFRRAGGSFIARSPPSAIARQIDTNPARHDMMMIALWVPTGAVSSRGRLGGESVASRLLATRERKGRPVARALLRLSPLVASHEDEQQRQEHSCDSQDGKVKLGSSPPRDLLWAFQSQRRATRSSSPRT